MKNQTDKIREEVRNLIERLTEKLPDNEYLEVLEEIEADVEGMIDCKKEELADE